MPHLPPSWAQHLESGCSNRLGACDTEGRPEICRALGAQARADGRIDVLVAADVGRRLIAALQTTRRVSHVSGNPATNRVLHLKGDDAEVLAADADHMALLRRCQQRFGRVLEPYGFDEAALGKVWYDVDQPGLRCVRFTPRGAWNQTPGVGAGAEIELLP